MSYESGLQEIQETTVLLNDRQSAWFRHLLLITTTIFGILVSLQASHSLLHPKRLYFSLAIISLSFSMVTSAIALYGEIAHIKRAKEDFVREFLSALREGRNPGTTVSLKGKFYEYSEIALYISLVFSVLFLLAYALI